MASGIYTLFKADLMRGVHDFTSDSVKVGLLNNSHSFTATNDAWADVSANETSGTGYSAGGLAVTGETVTTDDGDAEGVFDITTDPAWTSASFSAYHAVFYNDTPTSPTADPLICSVDFGGIQTVTSGTFTIVLNSEGLINIT